MRRAEGFRGNPQVKYKILIWNRGEFLCLNNSWCNLSFTNKTRCIWFFLKQPVNTKTRPCNRRLHRPSCYCGCVTRRGRVQFTAATSAARIAVRWRTEGICRAAVDCLNQACPEIGADPSVQWVGAASRLRRRVAVSGGSPAPAPRSARGGVPVLFRTLCPLHATAASTTPAAITATAHVRAAIARIGSVGIVNLTESR
jgi:hypothetical protein